MAVERLGAAYLLERARGRHHAVGFEVRRGALQAVCRASERFAVAALERFSNPFEVPRRIVDEQAADLGEQLVIAADAGEHAVRDFDRRR